MRDLKELRLNFNLSWPCCNRSIDQSINQLQVGLGIFNNEPTGERDVVRTGTLRKFDTLSFEKILGYRPRGYDGLGTCSQTADLRWGTAGRCRDEARRDFVFLSDQDIRVLRGWNHDNGVCFDFDLEICRLGHIAKSFTKWDIRERERDRIGCIGRIGWQLQHDIDAFILGVALIQVGSAFFDKIEGFFNGGIRKVDARNNNRIELVVDGLATAAVHLRLLDDGGGTIGEFSQRKTPGFINIGEHGTARLTVGSIGILLTRHIDFFHQSARGDVVFVNVEGLLTAFESNIVAPGCVVAVTLLDEALDFFDVANMPRSDRAAIGETLRIHELRAEGFGGGIIRIVAIFQDNFHGRPGIRIAPLGDTLACKEKSGVAESAEGLFPEVGGGFTTLRESIDGAFEKRVG